jgi:uncharacterized surface protein with fasciclin (FAS1) repeats
MQTLSRLTVASMAALALAACGARDGEEAPGTAEPADETLAAALDDDGQFSSLDEVIENAGLESVLQGVGPYTVIAPVNGAFESAGQTGGDFTDAEMRAQGAELVRAHLLPGAVTRADLEAAIERGGEGGAEMRTMSDGVLTFTRDGEAILVTADDGSTARLTGDEFLASNGVIQPVDAILVAQAEASAD